MNTVRNIGWAEALPALSRAAAADGATLDMTATVAGQHKPFLTEREYKALLSVGTAGTAMGVKFQESDDGTNWTDITNGAFTNVTTSATREEIHFRSNKRYIRVISHTQTGTYVFGVVLLGYERYD